MELTDERLAELVADVFSRETGSRKRADLLISLWWTTVGEDEHLVRFVEAALEAQKRECGGRDESATVPPRAKAVFMRLMLSGDFDRTWHQLTREDRAIWNNDPTKLREWYRQQFSPKPSGPNVRNTEGV